MNVPANGRLNRTLEPSVGLLCERAARWPANLLLLIVGLIANAAGKCDIKETRTGTLFRPLIVWSRSASYSYASDIGERASKHCKP